jgi:HEAT repeat protein
MGIVGLAAASMILGAVTLVVRADTPPTESEIQRLVQELGHEKFAVREAARKKLLEIGPAVLPALRKVPEKADPQIRLQAQALLKKIEQRQRIPGLIAELDNERFKVRQQAFQKLLEIGQDAVPALREAARANASPEISRRAQVILDQIEKQRK